LRRSSAATITTVGAATTDTATTTTTKAATADAHGTAATTKAATDADTGANTDAGTHTGTDTGTGASVIRETGAVAPTTGSTTVSGSGTDPQSWGTVSSDYYGTVRSIQPLRDHASTLRGVAAELEAAIAFGLGREAWMHRYNRTPWEKAVGDKIGAVVISTGSRRPHHGRKAAAAAVAPTAAATAHHVRTAQPQQSPRPQTLVGGKVMHSPSNAAVKLVRPPTVGRTKVVHPPDLTEMKVAHPPNREGTKVVQELDLMLGESLWVEVKDWEADNSDGIATACETLVQQLNRLVLLF
jgi:hypothetical protein